MFPSFGRTDVDGTMKILQKRSTLFKVISMLKVFQATKTIGANTHIHTHAIYS